MKRVTVFLLLAFVFAACQAEGPTVPAGSPQLGYGKPGCDVDPNHPSCKDDGGGSGGEEATAEVDLCAKKTVVDDINLIDEGSDPGPWPSIGSTSKSCECGPWPAYCPSGTLTYTTAGSEFEWKFNGSRFVPIDHEYVLIYYPDPWPGRNLICLDRARANRGGKIRFSGSMDLGMDLREGAKIWIVRSNWVNCGEGFDRRDDLDRDILRLTNDRDGLDGADATESCAFPFGEKPYPCDEPRKAYDWLFEAALITYDDTDV